MLEAAGYLPLLAGDRSDSPKSLERKVRTPKGSTPRESKGALNESSLRRKVSQKTDRFIGRRGRRAIAPCPDRRSKGEKAG